MKKSSKVSVLLLAIVASVKAYGKDLFPEFDQNVDNRSKGLSIEEIQDRFLKGQMKYDPLKNKIFVIKDPLNMNNWFDSDDIVIDSLRKHLGQEVKVQFVPFYYMDNPTQDRE